MLACLAVIWLGVQRREEGRILCRDGAISFVCQTLYEEESKQWWEVLRPFVAHTSTSLVLRQTYVQQTELGVM
jgi:hypothetical protein